jgi:hypothetical protein
VLTRCLSVLVLAATVLTAGPALAQAVASPTPPPGRALILARLTFTKIQDLRFGDVVPSTTTAGFVTINASTGARTSSPAMTLLPSDIGQRAYFGGAGTPGQQVTIDLTPAIELTNPAGDKITVLTMNLDGPTTRTISADHTFYVGVGGIIFLNTNQPEGLYTATFNITANYGG